MSLIITSNTPSKEVGESSVGINRPFSYVNNLNDTLKIPANAKVAVQSIKINKDSRFNISSINNKFSFFYGELLDENFNNANNSEINSFAVSTSLLNPKDSSDDTFQVTPEDLAGIIQTAGRKALFHPNLLLSTNNASSFYTEVDRNSSELDFEGFKFYVESTRNASVSSNRTANWITTNPAETNDAIYDTNTGVLSNGDNQDRQYLGTDYPLDLLGGVCEFEITTNQEMKFGLTRNLRVNDIEGNPLPQFTGPVVPWWETNNDFPEFDYYDYVCVVEADFTMKIYSAEPATDTLLEMIEFDYRFMNGGDYYNASSDNIKKVSFQVKNEQVTIKFIDDNGSIFTLTDGTSSTSASNVKGINMNTRFLYPKVTLTAFGDITLSQFQGVNITNWTYGDEFIDSNGIVQTLFMDYYAYVINNLYRQEQSLWILARDMDCKYTKSVDFSDLKGLDSFGLANYQPAIFTSIDNNYEFTSGANTSRLFGFSNRNPALKTGQQSVAPYQFNFVSDEVPIATDTQSIFVRLNSFTHETYNMGIGNYSKIIYHLPAFNNDGLTAGTFWYDANPMVYIDLNNTEPLFINDISIDLVKADETLADELIGKTIIVLHVIS